MKLACLVLAAGEGSRFGGCKQLAAINGKPIIMHCLDQLRPIPKLDVYTVVGAWRKDIIPVIQGYTRIIEHPNWHSGIGNSIACGIGNIESNDSYDGILITLADQILLSTDDYNSLTNHFSANSVVAAYYNGEPGVPAIFPRRLFSTLSQLKGDQGAKSLLKNHVGQLIPVPIESAATDIDTMDDMFRIGVK